MKEINQTDESGRITKLVLMIVFGLLVIIVPVYQLASELVRGEQIQELDLFRRAPSISNLRQYEDTLTERSRVSIFFRKRYQQILTDVVGQGNEKVVMGVDNWLFFRPSIDYITRPSFRSPEYLSLAESDWADPLPAIESFHRALSERGIELIILPVPGKATIYPDLVSRRYRREWGPVHNRYTHEFYDHLRSQGIDVLDPTDILWEMRQSGTDSYLPLDTHWSPAGMKSVARALAQRIRGKLGLSPHPEQRFEVRTKQVTNRGDISDMLQLASDSDRLRPISIAIEQVLIDENRMVEPDPNSPIVLLGDSFTNVFSRGEMGWGSGAGLGEHLALELGMTIDVIALNGGGPTTTRQTLVRRGNELSGKKLVIWQFATRDLANPESEWKIIEIPEPVETPKPVETSPGKLVVVGTTEIVSLVPDPSQVPYTECLTFIKYRVDSVISGNYDESHLLAVFWGMRSSKLEPATKFRNGETHRLILEPLSEHPELDHVMRADDTDEYELDPYWVTEFVKVE